MNRSKIAISPAMLNAPQIDTGARLDDIFSIISDGLAGGETRWQSALKQAGFAVCDLKIELIEHGLIPNDEFRGGCKPSSGTSCSQLDSERNVE